MARIKLPDVGGTEFERMWGLLPSRMAEATMQFNAAVSNGPLDPRLYELVRFRIAQINDCPN
jgi:alkylhydroperoxidase family enzyme